jgi:N-hydroxyarylamine O-acetyltransferase
MADGSLHRADVASSTMDADRLDRYLDRIGADRPEHPDAGALARLQERHLRSVPFENLDLHLGVPIVLDEGALFEKVVDRRRGGFCYELNGLFAAALRALGFAAHPLAARVIGPDGGLGPVFDHMAVLVELDEPWLADVGFGRFSLRPLRLGTREEQRDPAGVFTVTDAPLGDVDVRMDGRPQYRLELRPRPLADFEATCWWQQTSPQSHFLQGPVCSLVTDRGRVTLSGRLLVETVDGVRSERTVDDDAEVTAIFRERFGIVLDRLPGQDQRSVASRSAMAPTS